jgi:hypothetical protein
MRNNYALLWTWPLDDSPGYNRQGSQQSMCSREGSWHPKTGKEKVIVENYSAEGEQGGDPSLLRNN